MANCAVVSFRLGGLDGVSRVAALWQKMLENLGFSTYTIAGEGKADCLIPGLAIRAGNPLSEAELKPKLESELIEALAKADLVLVENLCTIPLNLEAANILCKVLKGRPAIMHHHDPPWQRPEFSHIKELPVDDASWRHVVINKITVGQMAERNISAVCIYNPFEINPDADFAFEENRPFEKNKRAAESRKEIRAQLGIAEKELLIAHPVRAVPRKNIPAALRIAEKLGGTYWISGQAEPTEDYEREFKKLLESAKCKTINKSVESIADIYSVADIYSAADLIVFPSVWESFGLPPVEAAIYGRHVVVGEYPVAKELMELGFKWFLESETDELAELLAFDNPDPENLEKNIEKSRAILENNFNTAKEHFSIEKIQEQIRELVKPLGF